LTFSDFDELKILNPRGFDSDNSLLVLTLGDKILSPNQQHLWRTQQISHMIEQIMASESAVHFLGQVGDTPVYSFDIQGFEELLQESQPQSLRSFLGSVPDNLFNLLGRAVQINQWYQTHRYCGACGSRTTAVEGERATECQGCNLKFYPRLSPCVMALVRRGPYCLLARNRHWTRPFYSVLAGFVEPGESVEQSLAREVLEEVGLVVAHPQYFCSQPWPFPGQLMLGFFADYERGDIVPDDIEIAEANWYHYSDLPEIPGEFTLSGQLIRAFVKDAGERYLP
jgi:NAD+ diphosphatase